MVQSLNGREDKEGTCSTCREAGIAREGQVVSLGRCTALSRSRHGMWRMNTKAVYSDEGQKE